MAMQNRFTFIGELGIAKDKERFCKDYDNGTWISSRLSFMVKKSNNNAVFVELFGGCQKDGKGTVNTFDTEKNKIEIPWKDRNNEETLNMIADWKKYKFNLGEEKIFVTEYDAVQYLKETLPTLNKKVVAYGDLKVEEYNGNFNTKFILKGIRLASEEESKKNKLTLNADLYYAKDSLDVSDFKEEKVLRLTPYISQHVSKEVGNGFFPLKGVILNAKKIDFENELQKKKVEYIKNKLTVKGKTYVHLPWAISIMRGAEEVDFDESMLTKDQLVEIELGISSIDDFKPKKKPLGNDVFEFRLVKPLLTEDFKDGAIDTELTIDEFEDKIYKATPKTEKFDGTKKKQSTPTTPIVNDDDEDLFGEDDDDLPF